MISSQSVGRKQRSVVLKKYCVRNLKKFLAETSLHALKYVGDDTISFWERLFFLCSFFAALITTGNLISNIYAKWDSTPVIIGISPHPTSISDVPFPAITICNVNQALLSKVSNYSKDTPESVLLKTLCFAQIDFDNKFQNASSFQNNSLNIADFIIKHAQPCSKMLLHCEMSSTFQNCSNLFREVLTDEGLCCVFNVLHPTFLYKADYRIINDHKKTDGREPVDWNPETGYQTSLPEKYYPRRASGTGVSMGISLILYADVDEYYCSTTNGPGFKVSLHNPIETPDVREAGLTIPIGFETRFRIEAIRSEAIPSIRSIHRNSRQCLFKDEEQLLYYKYYTRRNCESECEAKFFHSECRCIPYNLPLVYANATVCSVRDIFCINEAQTFWANVREKPCRKGCLPSCFDLSYLPDGFSSALAQRNYTIPSPFLRNMSKQQLKENIAVIHFYYRESVFHGELKNVYIGLTEFLSNTGGILGLFMGFSIISVVEIVYFSLLRPTFELTQSFRKLKQQRRNLDQLKEKNSSSAKNNNYGAGVTLKTLYNYRNSKTIGAHAKINNNFKSGENIEIEQLYWP